MLKIKDYGILKSDDVDALGETVHEMIADGWQPWGSLALDEKERDARYFQPIVMFDGGPGTEPEEPTAVSLLRSIHAQLTDQYTVTDREMCNTLARETGLWLSAFDNGQGKAGL